MDGYKEKIRTEFERVSAIETVNNLSIDGCIFDGIIDETAYRNSKYKCCFLLKEPFDDYDDDDKPIGGGYGFSNFYTNWDEKAPVNRGKTLSRASAIVYSINYDFCDTKVLTPLQIKEGFQSCCWINLSKTPANATSPLSQTLSQRVKLWSQLVQYQLLLANPDVLIFGNTWDWYYLDYPFKNIPQSKKSYPEGSSTPSVNIFKTAEGKIEVDAYHPGRKSIEYESIIINSIKDFLISS